MQTASLYTLFYSFSVVNAIIIITSYIGGFVFCYLVLRFKCQCLKCVSLLLSYFGLRQCSEESKLPESPKVNYTSLYLWFRWLLVTGCYCFDGCYFAVWLRCMWRDGMFQTFRQYWAMGESPYTQAAWSSCRRCKTFSTIHSISASLVPT